MSSTGYDTLSDFKIDLTVDPIQPINSIRPHQGGGKFTISDQMETPTPEMEANAATSMQQAANEVDVTSYMNAMANQFAGQYLPVRDQRRVYADQYYKALGLGSRYNPADFEAEIRQSLGELPKRSGLDSTLNFVIDALNGRTQFKGVAGALDILAQASGKALGRAEQDRLNRINYQMKVGELAVKQAQDANKVIMEKEADFFLKMMGYDNEDMTKFMSFNADILKDVSEHNLDVQKERIKSSLAMLNNLDAPLNVSYIDNTGARQTGMAKMVNTDVGPQLMLGRLMDLPDGRKIQVYDTPIDVGNATIIGKSQPGTEAAKLSEMTPSSQKIVEGVQDFASLDGIRTDISNILVTASNDINKLGFPGNIQSWMQTVGFNIESVLNELSKNSGGSGAVGTKATENGEMFFNRDQLKFDDYDREETTITLTDLPQGNNPFASTTKNVSVSMNDLFSEDWFVSQGYDTSYAENKVRENFIIYGLARANKPTGRLNVDDIKRASDAISIYGAKAPQDVIAALKEVDRKIRQAQQGLIRAYPEIILRDPTFSNPDKTNEILRGLGLNPDDFATYLNQLTQSNTSSDANAIQSEQPENEQQRTVPNEFDSEGEAVDIDDLFSISVEGVM
tara:strand:- start:2363 stop:4231 length:1869 start_codon:yes stop_codon:yes gene_type:complete